MRVDDIYERMAGQGPFEYIIRDSRGLVGNGMVDGG